MAEIFKIIPISSATADVAQKTAQDYTGLGEQKAYGQFVVDTMQRPLRDLRISVTDRCNLRCTYCMPREVFDENHPFLPRTELLNFEEIERIAKLFIQLGVQKIRLTGGEPLLRRGIEQIVESLAKLNTREGKPVEVALTTNAVLLSQKAQALKDAGLARITASLDGLTEETYRRMSDSKVSVKTVLDGIAAAQRVGLAPVKVNMVVKRGVNDHEIIPMAGHFRNSGIVLRFIEYMDVGCTNGWRMDDVVPSREIIEQINSRYPVRQVDPNYTGEVAERWHYADGSGEVGVIASVTQAFCHECTRARLSTDGKLYTCLFASGGMDLRGPLRAGATDQTLIGMVAGQWERRNDRYSQVRHDATALPREKIEMSYIGG
ncbi:MAG: GTP 3',8-cyclase MoaA [Gallionella sp.]|nr:GTP 3',8-cyclase MoaA [Gallionella sp.]